MNADRSKILAAATIVGLVLAAAEFYLVREFLGAFLIFAALFGTAGTALLIVVAVEESILAGTTHLEARLVRVRAQDRER